MGARADHDELHDLLCEAIDDSLDMDWQSGWAADSIIRRLEKEGLAVVSADTLDVGKLAERFCAAPLPESVCADLCATSQEKGRTGTNLLSVSEAESVLRIVLNGGAA